MRLRIVTTLIIILLAILFSHASYGEDKGDSSTVVFFPFDASQAGSYAAIKDGLKGMLASRLAAKEGIVIVENTLGAKGQKDFISSSAKKDSKVFAQLETHFVATSTMTAKGSGLLLRVDFHARENSEPIVLKMEAQNDKEIFSKIDDLVDRIAEKVFGHTPVTPVALEKTGSQGGVEGFRTAHPDKKYKEDIVSGEAVVQGGGSVNISRSDLVRRRAALPETILSMAVGDGNGDGRDEVFVASDKDLRVYHYESGILKQLGEHPFAPAIKVHNLEVADMDGDGRVEIYASAIAEDDFSSAVFTWNPATGIDVKMKNIRWAIRPLQLPGEGLVIAGQEKAVDDVSFLIQDINILQFDWKTKKIRPREKLFLPRGVNLFDVIFADIDGNGTMEKVAITANLKLAVYDQENNLIWLSEADYGGSVKNLGKRWREKEGKAFTSYGIEDENYQTLQYVPTRLQAVDVNNDGRVDIISAKNILASFRILSNLRSFSGGNIVCMSWNGQTMTELWGTDRLGGYIADFSLLTNISQIPGNAEEEDDNSTKVRLYVGQLPSEGFASLMTFSRERANLLAYEFNIIDKSQITTKEE